MNVQHDTRPHTPLSPNPTRTCSRLHAKGVTSASPGGQAHTPGNPPPLRPAPRTLRPNGAPECSHGWSAARVLAGEAQPVDSVKQIGPPRQGRRSPADGVSRPRLTLTHRPRPQPRARWTFVAPMQRRRAARVSMTPPHLSLPGACSPRRVVALSLDRKRGCRGRQPRQLTAVRTSPSPRGRRARESPAWRGRLWPTWPSTLQGMLHRGIGSCRATPVLCPATARVR